MPPDLPLSRAQARLGRPGRPRTRARPAERAPASSGSAGPYGGRARPSSPPLERGHQADGPEAGPELGRLQPRLLGLPAAAYYLGVGERTIKALVARGVLRPVRLPGGEGDRDLRRTLVDRHQLDALVDGGAQ